MTLRREPDVVMIKDIEPRGEALRRAVRWLSAHDDRSPAVIARAAERFDLSPLDTEFLLKMFAGKSSATEGSRGAAD